MEGGDRQGDRRGPGKGVGPWVGGGGRGLGENLTVLWCGGCLRVVWWEERVVAVVGGPGVADDRHE